LAGLEGAEKMKPTSGEIEIRKCRGLDELKACVAMQKEVWNFSDEDLIPLRMFVVAQKIGGQVIGAFSKRELVGFALSIPGSRSGKPYLHSHMLAVRESHRNSGLGRRMKFAQRDDALARNIELIEWTFDPLEIKNAFLNLEKLGAIARRYNINQYGITSSPLQGGLPTDRLVAEWWLRSRRVETLLATGSVPRTKVDSTVEVPAPIYDWKAKPESREQASEVQLRNREKLLAAFSQGLAAIGYERDKTGNGRFLVGRWDENWSYATSETEEGMASVSPV
jgi:predicted GNAT superfamily acetyltransferase